MKTTIAILAIILTASVFGMAGCNSDETEAFTAPDQEDVVANDDQNVDSGDKDPIDINKDPDSVETGDDGGDDEVDPAPAVRVSHDPAPPEEIETELGAGEDGGGGTDENVCDGVQPIVITPVPNGRLPWTAGQQGTYTFVVEGGRSEKNVPNLGGTSEVGRQITWEGTTITGTFDQVRTHGDFTFTVTDSECPNITASTKFSIDVTGVQVNLSITAYGFGEDGRVLTNDDGTPVFYVPDSTGTIVTPFWEDLFKLEAPEGDVITWSSSLPYEVCFTAPTTSQDPATFPTNVYKNYGEDAPGKYDYRLDPNACQQTVTGHIAYMYQKTPAPCGTAAKDVQVKATDSSGTAVFRNFKFKKDWVEQGTINKDGTVKCPLVVVEKTPEQQIADTTITVAVKTGKTPDAGTTGTPHIEFCKPNGGNCKKIMLNKDVYAGKIENDALFGKNGYDTFRIKATALELGDEGLADYMKYFNIGLEKLPNGGTDDWLLQGIRIEYKEKGTNQPVIAYWNPAIVQFIKGGNKLPLTYEDTAVAVVTKTASEGGAGTYDSSVAKFNTTNEFNEMTIFNHVYNWKRKEECKKEFLFVEWNSSSCSEEPSDFYPEYYSHKRGATVVSGYLSTVDLFVDSEGNSLTPPDVSIVKEKDGTRGKWHLEWFSAFVFKPAQSFKYNEAGNLVIGNMYATNSANIRELGAHIDAQTLPDGGHLGLKNGQRSTGDNEFHLVPEITLNLDDFSNTESGAYGFLTPAAKKILSDFVSERELRAIGRTLKSIAPPTQ